MTRDKRLKVLGRDRLAEQVALNLVTGVLAQERLLAFRFHALGDDLELQRFSWDPPWWNEREMNTELWGLMRAAARNWLKDPRETEGAGAGGATLIMPDSRR